MTVTSKVYRVDLDKNEMVITIKMSGIFRYIHHPDKELYIYPLESDAQGFSRIERYADGTYHKKNYVKNSDGSFNLLEATKLTQDVVKRLILENEKLKNEMI